jgi:hypothetical protein
LKIEFVPKDKTDSAPKESSSIIEGPGIEGGEVEDLEEPLPPPALEPILDSPPSPKKTTPVLAAPPPETKPAPTPTLRPLSLPTRPPLAAPEIKSAPLVPPTMKEGESALGNLQDVRVEYQPAAGSYEPVPVGNRILEAGERLRWRYLKDSDWRVFEAYGKSEVKFLDHHYEVSGNFFHSFRDGANRIQVPTIREARDRRDHAEAVSAPRLNLRLFVEVDTLAPKAPAPLGNCLVWQKGKLWLNDLVSGEVDSVAAGGLVDHLEVSALIPGVIFVLTPPSQVFVYAVKVDFGGEIFKGIGIEKGRADRELGEAAKLMQLADSPEKQLWCEGRMAYEQEQSTVQSQKQQLYESFLRNETDGLGLIRSGFPMPHIELAKMGYRHENLDLSVGFYSDHLGKCLLPANAFLWVNEAVPTPGTPFSFEVLDQSDPAFVGFDTRFRTEEQKLLCEERFKGSTTWTARDVVVDIYHYATFRPPQPAAPPNYLLDVTMDITGGLKRLNKNQTVTARLGTIELTPDQLRIEINPQLLLASMPLEKIVRDIMLQPLRLRDWYSGRRVRIHDAFEKVSMLPDEVLDEIEKSADELGMRVYALEKPNRASNPAYKFDPLRLGIELARTINPGEMKLEVALENEGGEKVQVLRTLHPKFDVLDLAARSVAINRANARLSEFRPLTLAEWLDSRRVHSLLSN